MTHVENSWLCAGHVFIHALSIYEQRKLSIRLPKPTLVGVFFSSHTKPQVLPKIAQSIRLHVNHTCGTVQYLT
uniref:Transcriptional regulator n=1 Tax=Steinernema glaseri TaxID=37863 RepID=A0A1I7ZXK7_9BILA